MVKRTVNDPSFTNADLSTTHVWQLLFANQWIEMEASVSDTIEKYFGGDDIIFTNDDGVYFVNYKEKSIETPQGEIFDIQRVPCLFPKT